jgi:hypothetical protein
MTDLSCQPRVSVACHPPPSIGRFVRTISAGLALSLPLAIAWAQPAQAILIYNFFESGGNLVVEGTGSLSLPTSLGTLPLPISTGLLALDGAFFIGTPAPLVDIYFATGPTTLGAGIIPTSLSSSSDSGIGSLLIYNDPMSPSLAALFAVNDTYISGASIFSSSTFTGITLASLGMPNSGTLGTWTLFDPGDPSYIGDTISVQVNASRSPASVPDPLPILGVAATFGFSRKLRKRIKNSAKPVSSSYAI